MESAGSQALVLLLAPPLASCVALGKIKNLSGPHFFVFVKLEFKRCTSQNYLEVGMKGKVCGSPDP